MQAIDIHAHVPRQPGLEESGIESGLRKMFRMKAPPPDPTGMAERYRLVDAMAVIFSVDAETATGDKPDSNDYVAEIVNAHPDVFMGFASVDPWKGSAAVDELERSVRDLGLRGLKLHPVHQAFYPDDARFHSLFAKCSELGVPVLIHTGYAAAGAGTPGGGGFKLAHSRPIPHIDNIAAEFPELTIIMAHPAWPWIEEQIAVALHKPNVYLDLSGWAPKYIPDRLIQEANSRLRDKVLFGSDYPYMPPERWLEEFEQLDIRDDVRPKILLENAQRVLGITGKGG
ncbi:MAG: amidohydrolase family protein [Dehalococcoidia bacterium]